MTDEMIIALFYKRDESAIQACMEQYGNYCRSIATSILSDSADAEEVVADTWHAAWNAIPPKKPTHLRLFLGRITRNLAIDILRRTQSYRRGCGTPELAIHELTDIADAKSPEEILDMKELSRSISSFLMELSSQHRYAFVHRYFYLEDISVIAEQLQVTQTNVRMMLSRTRKKLKKFLIQEGYKL